MCGSTKPLTPPLRESAAQQARRLAEGLINRTVPTVQDAWWDTFGEPLRQAIIDRRVEGGWFTDLPREAAAMALLIIAEELEHG